MRLVALCLVLLMLAPPAAWAEALTVNPAVPNFNWGGVTVTDPANGFTGGTPSNDDTFTIDQGHVVIEGDLPVTTGGIVLDGGTLSVPAESILHPGDADLRVVSGRLVVRGAAQRCHVIEEPDYADGGAGEVGLVLDCPTGGFDASNSTHWLVMADDDPADDSAVLNGQAVQVGAGPRLPGSHRPSYGKWRWIDISAVGPGDNQLRINYDPFTYTGTPYAGTRKTPDLNGLPFSVMTVDVYDGIHSVVKVPECTDDFNVDACTDEWSGALCADLFDTGGPPQTSGSPDGFCDSDGTTPVRQDGTNVADGLCDNDGTTPVTQTSGVPDGICDNAPFAGTQGADWVATDGDWGSGYFYFLENPANADDERYCPGWAAKIVGTRDSVSGNDEFVLAGDVSGCTLATALPTFGLRRGDPVYLVKSATIDGDLLGAVRLEGGTVEFDFATIIEPGIVERIVPDPDIARQANFAIYQGGVDGASTTVSGHVRWSQIVLPETEVAEDTAVYSAQSNRNVALDDLRMPNDGAMDLTGFLTDRLYVADCKTDGTGSGETAGCHGLYGDAFKFWKTSRLRVERMSDDGIGANQITADGTTGPFSSIWKIKHALVYEHLTGDQLNPNSQQCVEVFHLDGAGASCAVNGTSCNFQEIFELQDVLAMGCQRETLQSAGYYATIAGSVFGMGAAGEASKIIDLGNVVPSSTATDSCVDLFDEAAIPQTTGSPDGLCDSKTFTNPATNQPQLLEKATDFSDHIPNVVRDSILFPISDGSESGLVRINGELISSIMVGAEYNGVGSRQVAGLARVEASYLSLGDGIASILTQDSSAGLGGGTADFEEMDLISSVLITRETQNGRLFSPLRWSPRNKNLTIRRSVALFESFGDNTVDFFDVFDDTGETVNVDGFAYHTLNGINGFDLFSGTGTITLANVCAAQATDPVDAFGTQAGPTNMVVGDGNLTPLAADGAPPTAFVNFGPPDADPCKPREIGPRKFHVAHALLGDFWIDQVERWASADLITPVRASSARRF